MSLVDINRDTFELKPTENNGVCITGSGSEYRVHFNLGSNYRQRYGPDFISIASRFSGRAENPWKGLFVDGAQMKDGKDENIEAFWIDNDDVSQCENNLMVTKSLKIKKGKILDSFCKDKFEDYKCWREYKGIWLYIFNMEYGCVYFQREYWIKAIQKGNGVMVGHLSVATKFSPI